MAQQERYGAVMAFPELTISSSWSKSDQFGNKCSRAGHVINKVFWVTPYLAMAVPTHGSGHGTRWVLLLTGEKGPAFLLLLQQTCAMAYILSRNKKQHTPGHLGEEGAAQFSRSSQERECVLSKQPRKQREGGRGEGCKAVAS